MPESKLPLLPVKCEDCGGDFTLQCEPGAYRDGNKYKHVCLHCLNKHRDLMIGKAKL